MNTFPNPKQYIAKVINKKYLNYKTLQVDFKVLTPKGFYFVPGQFINIKVTDSVYRSYSVCSDYKKKDFIRIILTVAHNGLGANYLKNISVGSEVTIIGPSGRLVLPDNLANNINIYVTGTGLTPMIPILMRLIDIKCKSKIRLYYGNRLFEDAFKLDFLNECKKKLYDFEYYIYVSQPTTDYSGLRGRITDNIVLEDPKNTQVLICGNPMMVSEIIEIFNEKGVPSESIIHEKFVTAVRNV